MAPIVDVRSTPVSSLTGDEVICVPPNLPIAEVARRLTTEGIGAVGVGTLDDLEGIITERDIVQLVASGSPTDATTAEHVATTELVWATPETTISEIATEMLTRWVRHVLVTDRGRVVGIVSARDLLSAFAAPLPDEV